MPPLSLQDARAVVVRAIEAMRPTLARQSVPLHEALGRVLAQDVAADRDQPPFDRVTRDGFALQAADVAGASEAAPATLAVIGEAPPGASFAGRVGPGQSVETMTGAALVAGADAVVMVEYTERASAELRADVRVKRSVVPGENVVPRGSELAVGACALAAGRRLDPAAIGLLASLGCRHPTVFGRPRVAIVATGDELVELEETPQPTQIRNSNRHALAAQVTRAGGVPVPSPIARDDRAQLRCAVERALDDADLLLLSGGVSMGKYDFVEGVLGELGAEIAFDGVQIRPGRPLVFGRVAGRPFFGLPGNPLSTLVTFELFVRPALELAGGMSAARQPFTYAPLAEPYVQKPVALTAFVPARLDDEGLHPLPYQGSGDLAAMGRADVLMVVAPGIARLEAGQFTALLPK